MSRPLWISGAVDARALIRSDGQNWHATCADVNGMTLGRFGSAVKLEQDPRGNAASAPDVAWPDPPSGLTLHGQSAVATPRLASRNRVLTQATALDVWRCTAKRLAAGQAANQQPSGPLRGPPGTSLPRGKNLELHSHTTQSGAAV